MGINLATGIIIGIVLLVFSFYGMDFQSVVDGLKAISPVYLLPIIVIALAVQSLRSYRWGVLLRPLGTIDQLTLFSVTSVGFLAIAAFPARIGELARPYLISNRSSIPMASALATVVVERIIDTLAILAFFSIVLFSSGLPGWVVKAGGISLLVTVSAFLLVFPKASREWVLGLVHRSPDRLRFLRKWADQFNEGMAICGQPGLLVRAGALSMLIWGLNIVSFYLFFLAFGFDLPLGAAAVLMVIIIIGIAVPAAPGFIGNWHFACITGLAVFGIPKAPALSYAIVSHFFGVLTTAILGLAFMPSNKIHFADLASLGSLKDFLKGKAE